MSDVDLLRLLDARAESTAETLEWKREQHEELLTKAYAVEEEITRLRVVLGAVMAAARDIRSDSSRADACEKRG